MKTVSLSRKKGVFNALIFIALVKARKKSLCQKVFMSTDSYWFYPSLLSLDLVSVLDATLDFLIATADDVGCFRDAGACILVRTAPVV